MPSSSVLRRGPPTSGTSTAAGAETRTRDAVTPSLNANDVAISLVVYVVAYVVIFGAGLLFMARLVHRGFETEAGAGADAPKATPARPISAATRTE